MQIIDVNSWYKFMIDAISKGPHQTAPQLLCVGLPRKRHQWSAHESREVLAATVVFQWSATGLVRHWVQPANSSQGIGMKNKITTTWRSHLTDDPQKKHHDIMESIGVLYQCWWLRPREHSGSECLSYFEFCAKLRVQLQLCAGRNSSRMALVAPSTMSSKTTQGILYMFPSSSRSLLFWFMMEIHGKSIELLIVRY